MPFVISPWSRGSCQCFVSCGVELAIHVLLFIQYCPTAEHAKEGPRGQDEVIVEASAMTFVKWFSISFCKIIVRKSQRINLLCFYDVVVYNRSRYIIKCIII